MPTTAWVATSNIHLGSGASFVLAYTPGNVVPIDVVTRYGLAASGLVQTATIADDGTSPDWHGTDLVTQKELDEALSGLGGPSGGGITQEYADALGTPDRTPDTIMRRDAYGWAALHGLWGLDDVADTALGDVAVPKSHLDRRLTAAKDRANHTGTQTAATISDLREAVEDYVAALLAAGTNVTLQYTDNGTGTGSLTIASTASGGTTDPEVVRDTIGVALVGVGLVSVAVNDAGDTITVSTTATANATDAQLRDRSTHTGTQPASTISDSTTVGRAVLTAADAAAARTAISAASATVTANTQTGTAYTLVLADAGKAVEMSNAAANTLTVPPNSSVALPTGTIIEVFQAGAGQTTVSAGAGVTLRAPDGAKLAKQYASASLRKRGTDEWVLAGSVTV